jgi:hypothetical protein
MTSELVVGEIKFTDPLVKLRVNFLEQPFPSNSRMGAKLVRNGNCNGLA